MGGEALGLEITELRLGLGLPGVEKKELVMKKRLFAEVGPVAAEDQNSTSDEGAVEDGGLAKTRVLGWPPVCSYRQRSCNYGGCGVEEKKSGGSMDVKRMYVKVSMDGAPFLRKVDLNAFGGYSALSVGVKELFGSLGVGNLNGINDSENSEYVTIYEDKEGDWMLVGDVPWKMFIESCKRLRIMKASDAKGFNLQVRNPESHFRGITKKETKCDDH